MITRRKRDSGADLADEFRPLVKANLILQHNEDDGIILSLDLFRNPEKYGNIAVVMKK